MNVHILSNSPTRINSGFGIVCRNLALGLSGLGHNVSVSNMQGIYDIEYWNNIVIYPLNSISGASGNSFYTDEVKQFIRNLKDGRAEVVIIIYPCYDDALVLNRLHEIHPNTFWYYPCEFENIPSSYIKELKKVKKVIPMTKQGRSELIKGGLNGNLEKEIYHGYDPEVFFKSSSSTRHPDYCKWSTEKYQLLGDRKELCKRGCFKCNSLECKYFEKEKVSMNFGDGGEELVGDITKLSKIKDTFGVDCIYGFVGDNNGRRKRIDLLLNSYMSLNNKIKKDSLLLLHTLPFSGNGFNLIEIIKKWEEKHGTGSSGNIAFVYGYDGAGNSWSNEALNIFYNNIDINVTASSGEGFCVLPDSPILTLNRGVQEIKDIKIGDKVLTHKGRFMRVSSAMKREYNGEIIKITPLKLRIPVILTPEHKVLGINTISCDSNFQIREDSVCYPRQCHYMKDGRRYSYCQYKDGDEPWRKYKTGWIEAKELKKGDFVTYPVSNESINDIEVLKVKDYIDDFLNITGYDDDYTLLNYLDNEERNEVEQYVEKTISMNNNYSKTCAKIPYEVKLTPDLMRLFGYFIAEGDIAGDRQIEFTFNINENDYVIDVEKLMKDIFGLETEHITDKKINDIKINVHILRYSNKVLSNMFRNLFCPKDYVTKKGKGSKANIVRIPSEFLNLPLDKLREIIKGIWRGDGGKGTIGTHGYQIRITSKTLAHQLLYLLTKFSILPTLRINDKNKKMNKNWSLEYIIDILGDNVDIFDNIIGEKHQFRDVNYEYSRYVKGKNLCYIPIEDIETIKHNGEVWNLEIEEDNSYVSGIILHNCLPVIESMAVGKPQIAPRFSSFIELIGEDRGLLAELSGYDILSNGARRGIVSVKKMTENMERLFDDKNERIKLGENGAEWVKQFTWDNIVKEFDNLIDNRVN